MRLKERISCNDRVATFLVAELRPNRGSRRRRNMNTFKSSGFEKKIVDICSHFLPILRVGDCAATIASKHSQTRTQMLLKTRNSYNDKAATFCVAKLRPNHGIGGRRNMTTFKSPGFGQKPWTNVHIFYRFCVSAIALPS